MSKYLKVIEADVLLNNGIHITLSNNENLYFESYEYQDWLQETQNLEDYEYDAGEYYDDGDGSYSPAPTINWEDVFEKFSDIETVDKFYKSRTNLVIK